MGKKVDFTGLVFDYLTIISEGAKAKNGRSRWNCACKCGNKTLVEGVALRKGKIKSCGCRRSGVVKHGLAHSKEFSSWQHLKDRCLNKNSLDYKNYGGRGINVCNRWTDKEKGFENFISDMGFKPSATHSIDRFPNKDGDYEPTNCRWATPVEQARNTRRNKFLEYNFEIKTLSEWALIFNLHHSSLTNLLKRMPFENIYESYASKTKLNADAALTTKSPL